MPAKNKNLGETELEVLQHVWDLKEASVADVHERILRYRKVAYTTIMTVMKNLYEKGFLSFYEKGNSYIYKAKIEPGKVQNNLLSSLMNKVFHGSAAAMVQNLVEHESLNEDELERIQHLIDQLKGK